VAQEQYRLPPTGILTQSQNYKAKEQKPTVLKTDELQAQHFTTSDQQDTTRGGWVTAKNDWKPEELHARIEVT
jgi:hypothetical protein